MNCTDVNLARLCMQASQLTSLSNEAVVRLHETRGEPHDILHVFVDVRSILKAMTVVKWFTLLIHPCFLFAESEEELQEAGTEAELRGYSMGDAL